MRKLWAAYLYLRNRKYPDDGKRIVRYALFAVVCAAGTAWACARGNASPPEGTSPARGVLTLSGRVIDDAYIGNGVQWDPYEVHDVDGRFSAADRKRLTDRLEYMQPRFIRVMGGIRSYLTDGRFDPSRNMEDLHMILGFCNTHGVTVLLGDWGRKLGRSAGADRRPGADRQQRRDGALLGRRVRLRLHPLLQYRQRT